MYINAVIFYSFVVVPVLLRILGLSGLSGKVFQGLTDRLKTDEAKLVALEAKCKAMKEGSKEVFEATTDDIDAVAADATGTGVVAGCFAFLLIGLALISYFWTILGLFSDEWRLFAFLFGLTIFSAIFTRSMGIFSEDISKPVNKVWGFIESFASLIILVLIPLSKFHLHLFQ